MWVDLRMNYVRFYLGKSQITVWGILITRTTTPFVREVFATGPPGVSSGGRDQEHEAFGLHLASLTQKEFNAAFLNCGIDEISAEDALSSIDELEARYPQEV